MNEQIQSPSSDHQKNSIYFVVREVNDTHQDFQCSLDAEDVVWYCKIWNLPAKKADANIKEKYKDYIREFNWKSHHPKDSKCH